MKRWREVLGLLAAALLILSSAAHSFLGWKSLQPRIEATGAPADLVEGLRLGWHLGGMAMLVFGVIVAATCIQRLRNPGVSMLSVAVIGVAYILYGAWAMAVSGNPFFTIFIAPGILLLLASTPSRA